MMSVPHRRLLGCTAAIAAAGLLIPAAADAERRTYTLRSGPVAMGGFNVKYPRAAVAVPPAGSVVRMHARLVDARGRRVTIRDVMLHHIVFHRTRRVSAGGPCVNRHAEPIYGTGEENQSLVLPAGYGYRVRPGDRWRMSAMLMSHSLRKLAVYIQYRVTIDTSPRLTPVRAIWVRANGCANPRGYGVAGGGPPGSRSTKTYNWKIPIGGRIVAAGGHLHGGAYDMWMSQPACGDRRLLDASPAYARPDHLVYRARPILHEPGPVDTRWFSSRTGIPVRRGETLRLRASYDAQTPHSVMAIMHVYIAPERGRPARCGALPADRRLSRKPGRFRRLPPRVPVPLNEIGPDGRTREIVDPPWRLRPLASGSVVDLGAAGFRPRRVGLAVGASLRWRVRGGVRHTVRLANGPRLIGGASLVGGETVARRFPVAGRYELFCSLHPVTMHQIVDVGG